MINGGADKSEVQQVGLPAGALLANGAGIAFALDDVTFQMPLDAQLLRKLRI